jgi:hypothetical protein
MNGVPGERIRFWMEFRGAPVDRRDRSRLLTPWHKWRVEGDFTVPTDGGGDKDDDGPDTHTTPEVPDQEDVWGFQVTRGMCRCESAVKKDIAWADEARSTYEKCDVPQHETGAQVETCFKQYQPGTKVVATTDPGGNISKAKAPTNPCERISQRGTFGVHELFHRRQGIRIASRLGKAFLKKYNELRGQENQWERLKESFPRETEEFMRQWNDGHDWAQSEIEAYKWQRRFYQDVLRALKRICAGPPSAK